MRNKYFYALLLLLAPIAGHALSFDGVKEGTKSAVSATGNAVGKASDMVTDTVTGTKESLQDEATPEATRAKLDAMAEKTLQRLFADQADSRKLFDESVGYAVFDAREASFYVVAGYGRGVVVDRDANSRVYMKMATTGAGLSFGIGGWESQMVILFENEEDLEDFEQQGYDGTVEAGTMVGDDKDQLSHRFNEGRAVYMLTKKGWKIGAKLTGSRYWPDDELNETPK